MVSWKEKLRNSNYHVCFKYAEGHRVPWISIDADMLLGTFPKYQRVKVNLYLISAVTKDIIILIISCHIVIKYTTDNST
jgi:hypothetical protein